MTQLVIENEAIAERVTRLAERLGASREEAVDQAVAAFEANIARYQRNPTAPGWLRDFWEEYPLPAPTGLRADKAFFDDLSGEP